MNLLLANADVLATFDDAGREIARGALLIQDGWIGAVGTLAEVEA